MRVITPGQGWYAVSVLAEILDLGDFSNCYKKGRLMTFSLKNFEKYVV